MSRTRMDAETAARCLRVDPFEGDFGEVGDRRLRDRIIIARKSGPCSCCGEVIAPGTEARSRTDVMGGEIATWRWCHACCVSMAKSWDDGGVEWERRIPSQRGTADSGEPARGGG